MSASFFLKKCGISALSVLKRWKEAIFCFVKDAKKAWLQQEKR